MHITSEMPGPVAFTPISFTSSLYYTYSRSFNLFHQLMQSLGYRLLNRSVCLNHEDAVRTLYICVSGTVHSKELFSGPKLHVPLHFPMECVESIPVFQSFGRLSNSDAFVSQYNLNHSYCLHNSNLSFSFCSAASYSPRFLSRSDCMKDSKY